LKPPRGLRAAAGGGGMEGENDALEKAKEGEHCPFCHAYELEKDLSYDCDSCEYALEHGCCYDSDSTYGKIHNAKLELISRIGDYW